MRSLVAFAGMAVLLNGCTFLEEKLNLSEPPSCVKTVAFTKTIVKGARKSLNLAGRERKITAAKFSGYDADLISANLLIDEASKICPFNDNSEAFKLLKEAQDKAQTVDDET